MAVSKHVLRRINEATIERYNKRLASSGPGAYALGWGTKAYQERRFKDLLHVVEIDDIRNKSVLDIGCGLGDLYFFFKRRGINLSRYIGIDINDNFVKLAREKCLKKKIKNVRFEVRDLMLKPYHGSVCDTGIALGVINFKQKNHLAYTKRFIETAFASIRETLIINVISAVRNSKYPKESFIHYFTPSDLMVFGQTLTPFCSVIQDYAAEPQYECMLVMRKKPWRQK